jgi:hypothetical protein
MKLEKNKSIPSAFFGNYFCIIPNTNLAFVVISKNACSFLKKVAIYNAEGKWPIYSDIVQVHHQIGFDSLKSQYLMTFDEIKALEKAEDMEIIKFAVWRNPIDRIISTYKLFCMEKEFRPYFQELALYTDNSFERFMEFVCFELKKSDPLYMDEHIRSQVGYYSTSDVDEIVHVKDLNAFLKENGVPFIEEKSNKTHSEFKIESQTLIDEIKTLYKEDYDIPISFLKT